MRQEEEIESIKKVPLPDLEEELMIVDEEDKDADSENEQVVEEEDESGNRLMTKDWPTQFQSGGSTSEGRKVGK